MRYPNWNWSADRTTNPQPRYSTARPRQYGRGYVGPRPRSDSRALVSPETDEEARDIDLRDTPDRVRIAAELPDCSREDIRVSTVGTGLRIRAAPATDEGDGIDRTIALGGTIPGDDVDVTYDGSTLLVGVPKSGAEQ